MAGIRGRNSVLRVKLSSGSYVNIPGCQDIAVNFPTVGTLDTSDQDTLAGVTEVISGEPSEGSCEVTINFNPDEVTHTAIAAAMRSGTTLDWQVRPAGPSNKRYSFSGPVRAFPLTLSKNGLQTAALSVGVGDFGPLEVDA